MSRNLARQSYPQLTITSLALLVGLSVSAGSDAALSATTANTIEGTKPYLVTAHVNVIKAGNNFELLGLDVDSNQYFTDNDIKIKLASVGVTSIGSLTPTTLMTKLGTATTPTVTAAYKTPIASTDADDNDGDGSFSLTGSAVINGWYYDNGGTETALPVGDLAKSFCNLSASGKQPYLKISGPVTLSTRYGAPNSQIYDTTDTDSPIAGTNNPVRRFSPTGGATPCFALPNKTYNTTFFLGAPEWDKDYGFMPDVSPKGNFPTTGADGLYFDLIITGADASELTWDPVSAGGVTATMTKYPAGSPNEKTRVKIKLNGPVVPKVTAGGLIPAGFPSGNTASAFHGPALFVIEGKDSSGTVISYSFEIKTWFVNRGYQTGNKVSTITTPVNHVTWCANLTASGTDYEIPYIYELTNAQGQELQYGGAIPVAPYGGNSYNKNNYQRRIGAGLLTEWGMMSSYSGAYFRNIAVYIASETIVPFTETQVQDYEGSVVASNAYIYLICASRP